MRRLMMGARVVRQVRQMRRAAAVVRQMKGGRVMRHVRQMVSRGGRLAGMQQ